MHDPNGIMDTRSASPLAPDSVAAISDQGLRSLAPSSSPCNQKYTMRSNVFVLDYNVSRTNAQRMAMTPFPLDLGAILEIPVQSLIGTPDTGVLLRNSRIDTRSF